MFNLEMMIIIVFILLLLVLSFFFYKQTQVLKEELSIVEENLTETEKALLEMKQKHLNARKVAEEVEALEEEIRALNHKTQIMTENSVNLEEGIKIRDEEITKLKAVYITDMEKANEKMLEYKNDIDKTRQESEGESTSQLDKIQALENKYETLENVVKEKEIAFETRIVTLRQEQDMIIGDKEEVIHTLEDTLSLKDQDILSLKTEYEEKLVEKEASNEDILAAIKAGMPQEEVAKKFMVSLKKVDLIIKFDKIKQLKHETH